MSPVALRPSAANSLPMKLFVLFTTALATAVRSAASCGGIAVVPGDAGTDASGNSSGTSSGSLP